MDHDESSPLSARFRAETLLLTFALVEDVQRMSEFDDLLDQLERTTLLPRGVLARVVGEVIEYQSEGIETFVRRRHTELQHDGFANEAIWPQISADLRLRRFSAPALTMRQLRRLVYG